MYGSFVKLAPRHSSTRRCAKACVSLVFTSLVAIWIRWPCASSARNRGQSIRRVAVLLTTTRMFTSRSLDALEDPVPDVVERYAVPLVDAVAERQACPLEETHDLVPAVALDLDEHRAETRLRQRRRRAGENRPFRAVDVDLEQGR